MSSNELERTAPVATPELGIAAARGDGTELHAILDGDGPVDISLDVIDHRQAAALRAQAMRCRRLAHTLTDRQAVDTLLVMAREYDAEAQGLRPS